MKKTDLILVVVFAYLIVAAIIWVRINLALFLPILEASTLFFQLILAATVIAIMRNVIGIKTFGVFGPAIIAFGLIESGIVWGLVLYLDVFMIALLTSLALYSLGMPSSHRMAVVITVTAIVITILELIAETYHVDALEQSIFFPVLITSWLADRFVKMVKELDWIAPSKRLLGTVFAILVAFSIIHFEPLVMFVTLNPEMWGIVIIINIVLSLKVNFRLSEYIRFGPVIRARGDPSSILVLNRRNRDYIFKFNPANVNPLISKDKMKITMHQLSIPTPDTYAIIEQKRDLSHAEEVMLAKDSFVIKPSSGLGGEGILVVQIEERDGERRFMAKGREYSLQELRNHLNMILEGQFSTEWEDVAIIEQMVVTDPRIKDYYWKGVPDIRVIVLEGFPIMSMIRLPTRESGGAANMHKGGLGMGLTIRDGTGVNPYWAGHGGSIERHPDTGAVLTDLVLPDWPAILETAALAQASSRLGYAGVDIVLDERGPMVLEVNKRPGLEIQNTNLAGLLQRIRFVENKLHTHRFAPVHEKIRLAMEWDEGGWTA